MRNFCGFLCIGAILAILPVFAEAPAHPLEAGRTVHPWEIDYNSTYTFNAWDQWWVEKMNWYRADPVRCIVDFFPDFIYEGDKFNRANDLPLLSQMVTDDLGIEPFDYARDDQFRADINERQVLVDAFRAGDDNLTFQEFFDLLDEIKALEEARDSFYLNWGRQFTEAQIRALSDETKKAILLEGTSSYHNLEDTILRPKFPMALNPVLAQAAWKHQLWMIDTELAGHRQTEATGCTYFDNGVEGWERRVDENGAYLTHDVPILGYLTGDRSKAVGYDPASSQENLLLTAHPLLYRDRYPNGAWSVEAGIHGFDNYIIDYEFLERGHRRQIFSESWTEVGMVNLIGTDWETRYSGYDFYQNGQSWARDKQYENVGYVLREVIIGGKAYERSVSYHGGYITGVVYDDFDGNNFYTAKPFEGRSDFTLWAVHQETGARYEAAYILPTGGYQIPVDKEGIYKVYCQKSGCYINETTTDELIVEKDKGGTWILWSEKVDFVNPNDEPIPPPVDAEDKTVLISAGSSYGVDLRTDITGYQLDYKWYDENGRLVAGGRTMRLEPQDVFFTPSEDARFRCVATNVSGEAEQWVTVDVVIQAPELPESLTLESANLREMVRTQRFSLNPEAAGYELVYRWCRAENPEITVSSDAILSFENPTLADGGAYICEIRSSAGTVSVTFELAVRDSIWVNLEAGWNLVGLSRLPQDATAEMVLAAYDFWGWDPDGFYQRIEPEAELVDAWADVLWTWTEEPRILEFWGNRLKSPILTTGWNLYCVAEESALTDPGIIAVYGYANGKYHAIERETSGGYALTAGVGYWVYLAE